MISSSGVPTWAWLHRVEKVTPVNPEPESDEDEDDE